MKLYPLALCFILIAGAIFLSGCGSSQDDCANQCMQQEHSNCTAGGWEVLGTYPDCTCNFICPEGGYNDYESEPETSGEESAGQEITEEPAAVFATVTHAYVDAIPDTWDSESNLDGIIVYPKLKDASEESVQYEGIDIPVDIEVWTTKFDENTVEVKDRMVYSTTFTIDSWEYGHVIDDIMTTDEDITIERGIKIPFESITTLETDSPYGGVFIKMHMPDGTVYEASQPVGVQIRALSAA